ncbi:MAG: tRNA (adenosine(37)-N6)-threonylcarbamoyltransferase complex ATPase subunit type 1 TsaE [Acidobacteriota bacterium]
MQTLTTTSERETEAAGQAMAQRLAPGTVVLLTGPLGAGKTAFVRGLAAGLECDMAGVSSPTFTIIQEYSGPVRLQHVDLYRLSPGEVDDLLLEDLMDDAVMAVEWPDRWLRAPANAIRVDIVPTGDNERRLTVVGI